LAKECFEQTASYDQCIADYFGQDENPTRFPEHMTLMLERKSMLRYGENPHQKAAVYRLPKSRTASLLSARQLNGKELSYNNLLDLDAALSIVRGFRRPAAAVIKHNNPCGAATSHKLSRACEKALEGDRVSAFGSVIGFNSIVDTETAEVLCEPGNFIEAIVAPEFSAGAVGVLTTKPKWRENVRLMQVGRLDILGPDLNHRFISGGLLVQEADTVPSAVSSWKTVTEAQAAEELQIDIEFAWDMVRHVKSNAIVLARDTHLVGVGAGQMSRVDSVDFAIQKAGERAGGSILASDAFFPFPDSIDRAAEAGIVAIIQPGGSKKDDEVIEACNRHSIPMVFTGQRHFKH
jgi:phosphoribosylaminoimidazolecarboxamide formyltransferase/IMP cyclohydrolase